MSDVTIRELKRHLESFDENSKLSFSGGLSFYRLKQRGDDLVVLEFDEAEGYLSTEFKKRNPHVKVAFIDASTTIWDERGALGKPVDVTVR